MTEKLDNINAKNIWIDLILGKKDEHVEDVFVSNKAIESLTSITNWLKKQEHFKNSTDNDVKQIAINILTGHVLKIQREISPNGHKAVFINSFAEHPDMKTIRSDIHDLIAKKVMNSIQKTFFYSFVGGGLFGVIIYELIRYFT